MQQKCQSDNTNTTIVSHNFRGNKYSKNIKVAIQIIVSQDFGGDTYSKNSIIM